MAANKHLTPQQTPSDCLVIVVHGFNKKATDMQSMVGALQAHGWPCLNVNLPTLFEDINACVEALAQQINAHLAQATSNARWPRSLHFVAHSMGGLIVRQYIAAHWQDSTQTLVPGVVGQTAPAQLRVGHCVFIATPHQGSRLAEIAVKLPGYRRAFKPVTALLPNAGYQPLPQPRDFKLGLIAGTQSAGLLGTLLQVPNDGHVEVASVHSDDAADMRQLPYHHKNIHHQATTWLLTHEFLLAGAWHEHQR